MVVLAGYARPDFSGYYPATASLGFILLIAEYTVVQQFVMAPLPRHGLGIIGVLFLLHGLNGLRKDKQAQHEHGLETERLEISLNDYRSSPDTDNEYADVAKKGDKLPESERPLPDEL